MYQIIVDDTVLSEIVRRLVKAIDPDKIILFGSRAQGDFRGQSDVDLLIVKETSKPKHRRAGEAYRALSGIGVPKDILWYTPEEVEEWSEVKYHVTTRGIREGRVLHEKKQSWGGGGFGPKGAERLDGCVSRSGMTRCQSTLSSR